MSFEQLPQELEQGVKRFAQELHVSHDEAVLRLIETGLQHVPALVKTGQGKNPAEELIGLFSTPEDCALMDEVVAIAYEGRRAAAACNPAL